jgi:hypothetical protein
MADLGALLQDPKLHAAWTAIAALCDQAVAGTAHLVGVGAQLYALNGVVTSFTEVIDGEGRIACGVRPPRTASPCRRLSSCHMPCTDTREAEATDG